MNQSRAIQFVGLVPNTVVVAFYREDPVPDTWLGGFRGMHCQVEADAANSANTVMYVQDSPDGVTWTNRLVTAPIVPGGQLVVSAFGRSKWIRLAALSTGSGKLSIIHLVPEEHCSPGLWPDAPAGAGY